MVRSGRGALVPLAALVVSALCLGPGSAGGAIAGGPVATTGPSVIGTAPAGKHLTGLSGTWAGFGSITHHFQWDRCNAAGGQCKSIRGATSPTYALGEKDVGKTIGVTVSGTDSTGTAVAYSSLVGPIAPNRPLLESTVQPAVSGPPVEGKTLQVTTGTWSPVPAKITYAWERCNANGRGCAAVPNASGSSYTIGTPDLGHALLAVVQGTNGTAIQNTFSNASPAVVDGTIRGPAMIAGPSLGGSAIQGQQLTADTGIWTGVGPIAFAYRWYRCDATGSHCTLIHSATQGFHGVAARDVNHTVALTVRATDSIGTTAAYTSLAGPVAPADATLTPITLPTISGAATRGATLTVVDGLWSTPTSRTTYAWLRCNRNGRLCVLIPGGTAASHHVTAADAGHRLVVDVTGFAGAATQSALTAATTPIS